VMGSSIAPLAFLRFQKFRNYKESMSAKVHSQKQLSDQTIADQTDLKGNATRTVGAGSVRKLRGTPDRQVQPMPRKRKANPYFPYSPGRRLASRGNQAPRSSELPFAPVSTCCVYDRNLAFVSFNR